MEKIRHGGFKIGSEVNVVMYETNGQYSIEVERKGNINYIVGQYFSYDIAVETLSRTCR